MIIILGIASYIAIIYMIIKRKDEEKRQYFFGFIILINVISIELVNQLSAKVFEESANINYSLFFYPLVLVSVAWTILYLYQMSKEYLKGLEYRKCIQITVVESMVLVALLYFLFQHNREIVQSLGGSPFEKDSKIYQSSWLNPYTNKLFINTYTYNIVIFLSLLISAIKTNITKKEKMVETKTIKQNNI